MSEGTCWSPVTTERKHLTLPDRQGGEVLPEGEAIGEVSISFPGKLEGQCLLGRDKASEAVQRQG